LKILFDEDVPWKLFRWFPHHDVQSVVGREWGGVKNGALLQLIEQEGFDVFLTGDKNMSDQQRLSGRPFAVLVLSAINWPVIRPHVSKRVAAIESSGPGTVTVVECGEVQKRRR